MNNKEDWKAAWRAACEEEAAACDAYLELRDAKSNGCCHGKTIHEINMYDNQILEAAQRLGAARDNAKRILTAYIAAD